MFACVHCKRCVNNIGRLTGSQCPRKMVWTKFRKGQRDILVPYTCRFDMMRDDAERCCLLSMLILSASLLVFLLCVRGC